MKTRPSFFAGSFYPDNPKILQEKIGSYLHNVSSKTEIKPKILIVPHAGYEYSGQVAAYAYQQLADSSVSRVILVGCSHQMYFTGGAIWQTGNWHTPLGEVEIASDLGKKLIDNKNQIVGDFQSHLGEHSLEVQLPFLQRGLKHEFQILPILLGEVSEATLSFLVKKITKFIDKKTVLLVSSDLSHYPEFKVANRVDQKTIQAILTKDERILTQTIANNMNQRYDNLLTCVCGEVAVRLGMRVAKELGFEGKLLKYANSGDVSPHHSQVVGYAAIGYYEEERI